MDTESQTRSAFWIVVSILLLSVIGLFLFLDSSDRVDRDTSIFVPSKRLVGGAKASWSPDGTRLVCGETGKAGLQIVDVETGESVELTKSGQDPSWSPDGRFIAYVEPRQQGPRTEEVWVIRPNGESPRKLSDGGFPSWSKDSKKVFVHSRTGIGIFAVDVDDPNAKPEVYFDYRQSGYSAISPDGEQIAFGAPDWLVIADRKTGLRDWKWPTRGANGLLLAWSPDGTHIAFGSFRDFGLWVLDLNMEKAVHVARGTYTMPAWSADGSKLAFDNRRPGSSNEIWTIKTKDLAALRSFSPSPNDFSSTVGRPAPPPANVKLGQELEIVGPTLDGKIFDVKQYRGKVVLVSFWTAVSRACRAEMPNLLRAYKSYHKEGFEIVGISLDRSKYIVSRYVEREEMLWPQILFDEPGKLGWDNPLRRQCEVRSIPSMILLGRDGKVVSLEAHGDELNRLLGELLVPPYAPKGKLNYVDLQAKANYKRTEAFALTDPLNNLAELPSGEQILGGVKFQIDDGLLLLGSKDPQRKVGEIEGVTINRAFTKLYILHGTQWGFARDNIRIGEYRLHYEDDTEEAIPIVLGLDVRDWWNKDRSKPVSRGKIGWVGQNAASRKENEMIRLYIAAWKNPHPDKKVATIDLVARAHTEAGPFCVAMTVEEAADSP